MITPSIKVKTNPCHHVNGKYIYNPKNVQGRDESDDEHEPSDEVATDPADHAGV